MWRIGTLLVGAAFRALFKLRYAGAAQVPRTGPAIVAGNHVSALDGVVLALAVSERSHRMTRFLVAAEFFRKRRLAWALRLYRQIPVHRGTRDTGALDEATATVRGGALAGIFPEGRVNVGIELQRLKRGVARMALATGAPVIPVGIWGTQDRWPQPGLHARRPWRPPLAVTFGRPIEPEGGSGSVADLDRFLERVETGIADQVETARALAASR
jgi:1-acyl-sn-glycerol-3-phosphate acyltransferase